MHLRTQSLIPNLAVVLHEEMVEPARSIVLRVIILIDDPRQSVLDRLWLRGEARVQEATCPVAQIPVLDVGRVVVPGCAPDREDGVVVDQAVEPVVLLETTPALGNSSSRRRCLRSEVRLRLWQARVDEKRQIF